MTMEINTKICNYYLNKIKSYGYSQDQTEAIQYALLTVLTETEKVAILTIVFLAIGKIVYFLCALAVLSLLRLLCGGLHMKTYWGCLFFSLAVFLLIVYGQAYVTVSGLIYAGMYFLLFTALPLPTENHAILSKGQTVKIKAAAGIFLLLLLLAEQIASFLAPCIRITLFIYVIEILIKTLGGTKNEE